MSARQPDKALRRAVAELATASPEDIQAVLSGLEELQRETIEALLADYRGAPIPTTRVSILLKEVEPVHLPGLSAWLEMRLNSRSRNGGSEGTGAAMVYTMTQTAFDALRSCVNDIEQPDSPTSVPSRGEPARRGFLQRRIRP